MLFLLVSMLLLTMSWLAFKNEHDFQKNKQTSIATILDYRPWMDTTPLYPFVKFNSMDKEVEHIALGDTNTETRIKEGTQITVGYYYYPTGQLEVRVESDNKTIDYTKEAKIMLVIGIVTFILSIMQLLKLVV